MDIELIYEPASALNAFTTAGFLLGGAGILAIIIALLVSRHGRGEAFSSRLHAVSLALMFAAAVAGVCSLVTIEPYGHLKEWAAGHDIELTDTNVKKLYAAQPTEVAGTTYELDLNDDGTYTLRSVSEE